NPDNGQLLGGVLDTGQNPAVHCLAMVTWDGHNRYRASFDPECIGSPASVGVAALFSYDTAPSDTSNTPFNDVAPDSSSADPPVFAGPIVDPGPNGWGAFEFLGPPPSGFFTAAPDVASWDAG